MTATILDGKALAARLVQQYAKRAENIAAKIGRPPGLAVVIAGSNPASATYVKNKVRACERAGFYSRETKLGNDVTQQQVEDSIAAQSKDAAIDGILVQLPLPAQINAESALAQVPAAKDVDGFCAQNLGRLVTNQQPALWPCTPLGCMEILRDAGIDPRGKNAAVVGRSNIVGKPLSLMLTHAGATVTLCHSQTDNLAAHTARADILVAAIGRAHFITAEMIKPGAVVLDVGINRPPEGGLAGDVHPNAAEVAGHLTPVPGGVGPMTIAMLLHNTLTACEAAAASGG